MRLREMRNPIFGMGLLLYFVHYLLSNATNYVFPIFVERGLGLPLRTAGWLNTGAGAVSVAVACAYIRTAAKMPSKNR